MRRANGINKTTGGAKALNKIINANDRIDHRLSFTLDFPWRQVGLLFQGNIALSHPMKTV